MIPPTAARRRLSPEDTLALWQQYKDSSDPAVRDRLVLTFAPLVKYIVYKKVREMPARCEVEDFISCGLEALIQSIDRYDPAKGATLEQYAWTRIHGAVLDELRRQDWAPRSIRRWERDVEKAVEEFTALHRRRPTREELAEMLGTTVAELRRRQDEIQQSDMTSLNTLVLSDDETTIERIDTLASTDVRVDPEHATADDGGQGQVPRGLRPAAAARARDRRPALRQEPDPRRDRRDHGREREPRLPDPRPDEEDAAQGARRRRRALSARRVGRAGTDTGPEASGAPPRRAASLLRAALVALGGGGNPLGGQLRGGTLRPGPRPRARGRPRPPRLGRARRGGGADPPLGRPSRHGRPAAHRPRPATGHAERLARLARRRRARRARPSAAATSIVAEDEPGGALLLRCGDDDLVVRVAVRQRAGRRARRPRRAPRPPPRRGPGGSRGRAAGGRGRRRGPGPRGRGRRPRAASARIRSAMWPAPAATTFGAPPASLS